MRLDSHHHLWNYSAEEYSWIDDNKKVIRRDFGLGDLQSVATDGNIDQFITVQARQSIAETDWLLSLCERSPLIAGVVGWVPLVDTDVKATLDRVAAHKRLLGVRHVIQDEPDDRFILREDFNRGVRLLHEYSLVYDILIFAKHLRATIEFVDQHPAQIFVLDHIAKPTIASVFDEEWEKQIRELAKRPNVACKFSGVATEVRAPEWSLETIKPYFDVVLNAFGTDRLMFGSDWPVCLLKTNYTRWVKTCEDLIRELSTTEQQSFWYQAAMNWYRIPRK